MLYQNDPLLQSFAIPRMVMDTAEISLPVCAHVQAYKRSRAPKWKYFPWGALKRCRIPPCIARALVAPHPSLNNSHCGQGLTRSNAVSA
jgi:hypothetical protein